MRANTPKQTKSDGVKIMRHTRLTAMIAIPATAIVSWTAFSSPAQARGRHHQVQHHRYQHAERHFSRYASHRADARQHCARHCGVARAAWHSRGARHHFRSFASVPNRTNLASIGSTLAVKAREIVASCASSVISSFRPGARIAGSGHASMHASGRAVDIRGNPSCIYGHLQGWPGGYSVDYGAVQHVHISLGGHEDGLRFSHHRVRHG
jgi:hypothetical protein